MSSQARPNCQKPRSAKQAPEYRLANSRRNRCALSVATQWTARRPLQYGGLLAIAARKVPMLSAPSAPISAPDAFRSSEANGQRPQHADFSGPPRAEAGRRARHFAEAYSVGEWPACSFDQQPIPTWANQSQTFLVGYSPLLVVQCHIQRQERSAYLCETASLLPTGTLSLRSRAVLLETGRFALE